MKNLFKATFAFIVGFAMLSCDGDNSNEENIQSINQKSFSTNAVTILEELTEQYLPKGDVKLVVFKDENGVLTAKYELTGETKKYAEMGSFVGMGNRTLQRISSAGTTCSGKISCGRAIYRCLKKGTAALIRKGACYSGKYCVTCLD